MPARDAPRTFVIPGRFHPGWSLLGRALRRLTGDRLRAEALHLVLLTGGALLWLMAAYAAEALAGALTLPPLALWCSLGGAGGLLALVGAVGFRPQAQVTCSSRAVRIERGHERLHLPYDALASTKTVGARAYHRRYRRYAAVRPFLAAPGQPVVLLHVEGGPVAALGLCEADRAALARRIEREEQAPPNVAAPARP